MHIVDNPGVNYDRFLKALKECEQHVNSHDAESLCRSFPKRLQKLVDNKGQRLMH